MSKALGTIMKQKLQLAIALELTNINTKTWQPLRKGGLNHIWHNEIRDTFAEIKKYFCKDGDVGPIFMHLLEVIVFKTSTSTNFKSKLMGLWGSRLSRTFFNVRILNSLVNSCSKKANRHTNIPKQSKIRNIDKFWKIKKIVIYSVPTISVFYDSQLQIKCCFIARCKVRN